MGAFIDLFDVFGSIWLVVDMILDCLTAEFFYTKAINSPRGFVQADEFPFFVCFYFGFHRS